MKHSTFEPGDLVTFCGIEVTKDNSHWLWNEMTCTQCWYKLSDIYPGNSYIESKIKEIVFNDDFEKLLKGE